MKKQVMKIVGALLLTVSGSNAFQISSSSRPASSLNMASTKSKAAVAPRFDKATQKWIITDPDTQGPSAGYGLIGSLYRAGPVPVITRIFNQEQYEQAVLKFMAREGCGRIEAQGNMDAYFENPQDWAYQKMCEQNGAFKKDYANANMNKKQIALSTVWAGVVFYFAYDLVTGLAEGRYDMRPAEGMGLFHGNLWNLPF